MATLYNSGYGGDMGAGGYGSGGGYNPQAEEERRRREQQRLMQQQQNPYQQQQDQAQREFRQATPSPQPQPQGQQQQLQRAPQQDTRTFAERQQQGIARPAPPPPPPPPPADTAVQFGGPMVNAMGGPPGGLPGGPGEGNPMGGTPPAFTGDIGAYLSNQLNSVGQGMTPLPTAYQADPRLAQQVQLLAAQELPDAPQYQMDNALMQQLQQLTVNGRIGDPAVRFGGPMVNARSGAPISAAGVDPIGAMALPAGIDPRAVAADPQGFQRWMAQAQQQEAARPGSTMLSSGNLDDAAMMQRAAMSIAPDTETGLRAYAGNMANAEQSYGAAQAQRERTWNNWAAQQGLPGMLEQAGYSVRYNTSDTAPGGMGAYEVVGRDGNRVGLFRGNNRIPDRMEQNTPIYLGGVAPQEIVDMEARAVANQGNVQQALENARREGFMGDPSTLAGFAAASGNTAGGATAGATAGATGGSAGVSGAGLDPMAAMAGGGASTSTAASGGGSGGFDRLMQDAYNTPSGFDNDAVMQLYDRMGQDIDDQYAQQQTALREEMAARGLSDSSIQGGRLADLNVGQRQARTELANQLGIQRAQDFAQQRNAVLGLGLQGRGQDLSADQASKQLGLSYQQLAQQGKESAAARALQQQLGMADVGLRQQQLAQQAAQFGAENQLNQQRFGLESRLGEGRLGLDQTLGLGNLDLNKVRTLTDAEVSRGNLGLQTELGRGNLDLQNRRFGLDEQGQRFGQQMQGLQFQNQLGQQNFQNQLASSEFGLRRSGQAFNQGLAGAQFQNQLGQQGFQNQMSVAEINRLLGNDAFSQRMGITDRLTNYGQQAFNNDMTRAEFDARQQDAQWRRYLDSIVLGG